MLNLFKKNPSPDAVSRRLSRHCGAIPAARFLRRMGRAGHGHRPLRHDHAAPGAAVPAPQGAEKPAGTEFSQAVFDLFFKDMDRSLREMGAGDLAVPKKIRKMGDLFYG